MTPERLDEIAHRDMHSTKITQAELDRTALLDHVSETYDEIERLRAELGNARVSAEEAWNAYDDLSERHERKTR